MKNTINLSEIREEYKKAPRFSAGNTHEAYIVKHILSARRSTVGVNYWTKEEAAKGSRVMDGVTCQIIAPLYV